MRLDKAGLNTTTASLKDLLEDMIKSSRTLKKDNERWEKKNKGDRTRSRGRETLLKERKRRR
jgi:hypothetical protein